MITTSMTVDKDNTGAVWVTMYWGSMRHFPQIMYAGEEFEQGWFTLQEMEME